MRRVFKRLSIGLLALLSLGLGLLMGAIAQSPFSPLPSSLQLSFASPSIARPASNHKAFAPAVQSSALPAWADRVRVVDFVRPPQGFGHLPYAEAKPAEMIVIGSYSDTEQRFERLNQEAGLALMHMLDAARIDRVWLVPVSGFRDVKRQSQLFQLQATATGSEQGAARTVAPPGYSEHHTGFAIDLTEGLMQGRDISDDFAKTRAFKWLSRYAREFGFELSFPDKNIQGVKYEPWHWRYVGSPEAKQVFRAARGWKG